MNTVVIISDTQHWLSHTYTCIQFSSNSAPIPAAVCSNMDEARDCHTEWSQSAKRNIIWYPLCEEPKKKGYNLVTEWAYLVAQLVKNPPAMQETWVQSLGEEGLLEKGTTTHSSRLAWRFPGGLKELLNNISLLLFSLYWDTEMVFDDRRKTWKSNTWKVFSAV